MARTAGSTSSTEPPSGTPRVIPVGRVRGAHGLRGQIRVAHFGNGPEHLLDAERVWVAPGEDAGGRPVAVLSAAPGRRGEVRMRLEGVTAREAAEALTGQLVLLEADRLSPLAGDEYYAFQLVGCRVWDHHGRELGCVRAIWATGAADLLVVESGEGRDHLIPAAEAFLREVDVEGRRIVVYAITGLLDE